MNFRRNSMRRTSITVTLGKQPARRGSMVSVRSLEELLTCPIHMDLLEDARSLPCGHVFCRSCLDRMLHNRSVECPICRARHQIPSAGAASLPAMYTQNHIVKHITDKKQTMALRSLQSSDEDRHTGKTTRSFSISTKTDLLRRLVEDISKHEGDGSSAQEMAGRKVCIEELNTLLSTLQQPGGDGTIIPSQRRLSDSDLTTSSVTELHNVDHQRRMMHRSCVYKKEVKLSVRQVMRGLKVSCVDFLESPNAFSADKYTAIIVDASRTKMYVMTHSGGNTRCEPFEPRVGSDSREPILIHYLQCLNGCVHLCVEQGRSGGTRVGLMLQCDVTGRLLSRSPMVNARDDHTGHHPPICGFFYDEDAHEYLVTRPSEGKVSLWGDDYRSKCDYNFDCYEAHPYFVVRVKSSREVWMSCPTDKIVVILDEVTSVWKKLDTTAIYNSLPGHLSITSDERIIFVDSREQRVFWMTRMGNNLPVQRLIFRGVNLNRITGGEQQNICCIHGLADKKLMIATENCLIVCKPHNRNGNECCVL